MKPGSNSDQTNEDASGLRNEFDGHLAECRDELVAFLERRIGVKLGRRLDVNDLLQDTCLAAFQQFRAFRECPVVPVRIWLLKIAQQQLVNAYRHHLGSIKRTLNREQDWVDCSSVALAEGFIASGSSPSKHLHVEELKTKLQSSLEELNEVDREVLLMRHFEGRPYADIAMLLDLEENTARQRFGRTLLRLREITKRLGLLDHLS